MLAVLSSCIHFLSLEPDQVLLISLCFHVFPGLLFDYTQDYTVSFMLAGGCMFIAALLMIPPWIMNSNRCTCMDNNNLYVDHTIEEKQIHTHQKDSGASDTLLQDPDSKYLEKCSMNVKT